jgi:hypothetical protein
MGRGGIRIESKVDRGVRTTVCNEFSLHAYSGTLKSTVIHQVLLEYITIQHASRD